MTLLYNNYYSFLQQTICVNPTEEITWTAWACALPGPTGPLSCHRPAGLSLLLPVLAAYLFTSNVTTTAPPWRGLPTKCGGITALKIDQLTQVWRGMYVCGRSTPEKGGVDKIKVQNVPFQLTGESRT
jgi:hypothetical protein